MHASVHRRRWGYVLVTTAIAAATITATTSATGAPSGTTGASSTYLVVTSSGASTSKAVSAVTAAGGTVVADYSQIGVVVARGVRQLRLHGEVEVGRRCGLDRRPRRPQRVRQHRLRCADAAAAHARARL